MGDHDGAVSLQTENKHVAQEPIASKRRIGLPAVSNPDLANLDELSDRSVTLWNIAYRYLDDFGLPFARLVVALEPCSVERTYPQRIPNYSNPIS